MRSQRMVLAAVVVGSAVLSASSSRAADDALTIGDPAPPIVVAGWVKGEPVESFQDDKVYVVEFWATWCGPCRTSIPHLTELQKTFKDKGVEVIGVSAFESDPEGVEPFVEEMGDKMVYHVAKDLVPNGGARNEGKMAQSWMQAAQEGGIPTAFIVQKGKVAWIGHPMSMDEPLAEIVSGNYDIEAARTAREQEKDREQKLSNLQKSLASALRDKDNDKALEIIDAALADDPELEQSLAFMKFSLLQRMDQAEKLVTYGNKLIETTYKDIAPALNQLAWMLVDPKNSKEVDEPVAQLALKAARRANELNDGKDPATLDTLARASFVTGQTDEAVSFQTKAVELAGENADDGMKERLEQYKNASDKP